MRESASGQSFGSPPGHSRRAGRKIAQGENIPETWTAANGLTIGQGLERESLEGQEQRGMVMRQGDRAVGRGMSCEDLHITHQCLSQGIYRGRRTYTTK